MRDLLIVGLALLSLAITSRGIRARTAFHWAPTIEIAKIFSGIFLTIIPVIAMLQAGKDGALSSIAEDRGIAMPRFFGYFAYASLALLPLLAIPCWSKSSSGHQHIVPLAESL